MSEIKLKLETGGETFELEMHESETVLEAALRQGVDAPYSCMAGVCTACQATLVDGTVEMESHDILSDEEVEKDKQVLCCQAKATSASLHIQYPS